MTTETLASALYAVPADDREVWVRMAMAVKSELGDAGHSLWDEWSRQSERYREADARAVWRSCKATGGLTVASLYHEAKQHGWGGEAPLRTEPTPDERRRHAEAQRQEALRQAERERAAAARAADMLLRAEFVDPRPRRHGGCETPAAHPYLVAKGFPQEPGLVLDGNLLVPMRDWRSYDVQSVQAIAPDGTKRFLAGGKASGAVYKLGRGGERWYCEGYATALSVRAALKALYRDQQSEVRVCFSSANLARVAGTRGYVLADHDWWSCPACSHRWDAPLGEQACPACGRVQPTPPAGEHCAAKTGLPYWMPPEPGTDANDFMQEHGVAALAEALRLMLQRGGR